MSSARLRVEFEQEEDGRWLAEVVDLPGAVAYGNTREEALARAEALALRFSSDYDEAAVAALFTIAPDARS